MKSRDVVVNISDDGGRKMAMLVSLAGRFSSKIHITYKGIRVNAKSIMGVMNLVPYSGDTVKVSADGEDEQEALDQISAFFQN